MFALASDLRGFASSALRVRVLRTDDHYAWVVTADLLDAGTPLTLDLSQIQPEAPTFVEHHNTGLVTFG